MLFGTREDEATSMALLDAYVAGGGVWIDTANCYAFWVDPGGHGGQSEALLGRWLRANPGVRDQVLISTKVGCEPLWPGSYPEHAEGLSVATVRRGVEDSLHRLGTDHVDLLWAHRDDPDTPLPETVAAFGQVVRDGLAAAWGYSNTALWRVERARGLASTAGTPAPTALQLRHSYLQPRPMVRDHAHDHRFGWVTDEVLDYAERNSGIALWAYSPLLGGAYDRPDRPVPDAFRHEGNDRRLAALTDVARRVGRPRGEVVLAWLAGGRPPVVPIVGVSSPGHVHAALTGAALTLPDDLRAVLDAPW